MTVVAVLVIIFTKEACLGGGKIDAKYSWQELYKAALLETDWSKIEQKIQEADNGMRARLHEFSMNHGGTPEENRAIEDALHGLNILRRDVAAWQGSKQAC